MTIFRTDVRPFYNLQPPGTKLSLLDPYVRLWNAEDIFLIKEKFIVTSHCNMSGVMKPSVKMAVDSVDNVDVNQ